MIKKRHNPKSNMPALYVPCWLSQVSNSLLSFAAKCLYGRLAQWTDGNGNCFRSYNQLAEELGSTKRSICDYVKELKDCGLIDTFQPQKGGLNHFVFYDHNWMYQSINDCLVYKSEECHETTNDPTQDSAHPPTQDSALPRAGFCATPTQNPARININKVKQIKTNTLCELNSDYEYPETLYEPKAKEQKPLTLADISKQNPYDIPIAMIMDWLSVRKGKRAPVSQTAWNRLLKQLAQCAEKNISAIEAFEIMVANGWLSLNADWMSKGQKKDTPKYDNSPSSIKGPLYNKFGV